MNIAFNENASGFNLACPIHLGDNPRAVSINPEKMMWACWTRECHKQHGSKLSNFFEALEKTYNTKINCSLVSVDTFSQKTVTDFPDIIISQEKYISTVKIPSVYFINRGYSRQILIERMIGSCFDESDIMLNRAVVPILNQQGNIVGLNGRTMYNQCDFCEEHHHENAPCNKYYNPKWLLSKNFYKNRHLYNLNFAQKYIKETGTVILVEGCADVWRLEDAAIYNSIAMLGIGVSPKQKQLLKKCGTENIVLCTNNDIAGIKAKSSLYESLSNEFHVTDVKIKTKDLETLNNKEINHIFRR